MTGKRIKQLIIIATFLLGITHTVSAQFVVTGSTCVLAGQPYQYNAIGNDTMAVQVCIQGGVLLDTSSLCYSSPFISYTRVTWNAGIEQATLSYHSTSTDTTLIISFTQELSPGRLDSASVLQVADSSVIPASIICAAASGGHCTPAYKYQWQQSTDAQHWTDVDSATEKDFVFSGVLPKTTYYRRKVLEEKSNVIDYSDVALMIINQGQNDGN